MATAQELAELRRLDTVVQERLKDWAAHPAPAGFTRCDGYYGCGALRHESNDECPGCGRVTLKVTWGASA